MTSRESSPEVTEWPVGPEWPEPNPLPFQDKIDLWLAAANPRPTSEEVRVFIRDVGLLAQHSLLKEREMVEEFHNERLEVRTLHSLFLL